ncbi:MAG: flagellar hook-length control protein FliK [Marinobacter sp.]|nr:flagellar hook-length control protein FliK [Marinobacter sp.]
MAINPPSQGQPTPPVDRTSAAPTGSATGARPTPAGNPLPAAAQLDALDLPQQKAVLAKVAQLLTDKAGQADQLLLDVKGRSLVVQAAVGETRLQPGDWVKVMRSGNELTLMGKLAAPPESRIAQALAQRLPWQQRLDTGLSELLAAISKPLPSQPAASPNGLESLRSGLDSLSQRALPPRVQEAIQQLVSRLPHSESLRTAATGGTTSPRALADQIRHWITESGSFTEARLARAPQATLPDLKLALGRIITAILAETGEHADAFNRYTPLVSHDLVQAPLQFPHSLAPPSPTAGREPMDSGQMLRLLAGMLNRIAVNQLHSQALTNRPATDAPVPTTVLVELPWVNPNNEPRLAQLRLERDNADQNTANQRRRRIAEWRFSLTLDLDDAGPVCFEVSLRAQQVSARVWAERAATLRQANSSLSGLRSRLTDLGLEVVDLECRRGSPQGMTTRLEQRLVDTRA